MQARRREGRISFPMQPPLGLACPALDQKLHAISPRSLSVAALGPLVVLCPLNSFNVVNHCYDCSFPRLSNKFLTFLFENMQN